MAKIIIKDGQLSSSAGINVPGSFSVSGNMVIGDSFTDTLIINSTTTFNDDLAVLDTISGSVGKFGTISGSVISASQYIGPITASPAGTSGQIQFNSNSVLSADSNFVWDNTNKRLGIGITAPQQALDVVGSMRLSTGNIYRPDNAGLALQLGNSSNSHFGTHLFFNGIGNAERVRITDGGNVGIGTSSPGSKLTIGTDFASTSGITVDSANSGDSQLVLRKSANKTAFSVLAWDSATYLGSGLYYDNSSWVHHNVNANSQLLILEPGAGVNWFASNNSSAAWNVANGVRLWDDNGTLKAPIRFKNDVWIQSDDSRNRFNFGTNGTTYFGTANNYQWRSPSDTDLMLLDSVGKLGIGTTSPATPLNVVGEIRGNNFSDNFAGAYNVNLGNGNIEGRGLVAGYSGGSYGGIGYNIRHTTTGGTYISPLADTTNYIQFSQGFQFLGDAGTTAGRTTNFTELMRITNAGNVGIGTTSPQSKLDVNGIISIGGKAVINTTGNGANDIYGNFRVLSNDSATIQDGMYINYNSTGGANAHIRFYANGTNERMRIDASNGNVGIGTGAPSTRLHIANGSGLTIETVGATWANIGADVASANYMQLRRPGSANALGYIGGGGGGAISAGTSNDLAIRSEGVLHLATGNSPRVTITSAGNVGIGTSNPNFTLAVTGTLGVSGNTTIANGNLIIGTGGKGIDFSAATNAAGMTNEIFDDYEVGTWTPALAVGTSTFNYDSRSGRYVKIGNLVYASFTIDTGTGTSINASSISSITGLPFTSVSNNRSSCQIHWSGLATAVFNVFGVVEGSQTYILLYVSTAATAGSSDMSSIYFDGSMILQGSVVYQVS